jgi:hypothetical protein
VKEEWSHMILSPGFRFHSRIIVSINWIVSAVVQMSRMKKWGDCKKLNRDATFWAPADSSHLLVSPHRVPVV